MLRTNGRRVLPVRAATLFQAGLLVAGTLIPHLSLRGALPKSAGTASERPPQHSAVRELYIKRCARCHDRDGTGVSGRDTMPPIPDFTSAWWQQKRSTAQLVASVLEGKGTRMPAFAERLNNEDARQLVTHIRAFNHARPADSAEQASGDFETRFRELQEELERLRKQFQDLRGAR